jgi:hypothetical protein
MQHKENDGTPKDGRNDELLQYDSIDSDVWWND